MTMVDRDGVNDHLRHLAESLKDWQRYQSISLDELVSDRDKQNMVLHALLIAIQSAIDSANHVVAQFDLPKPATYREAFETLSGKKMLAADLAEELASLAGFRNVLVHVYWKLDLNRVHAVLMQDLKTMRKFETILKRLLSR